MTVQQVVSDLKVLASVVENILESKRKKGKRSPVSPQTKTSLYHIIKGLLLHIQFIHHGELKLLQSLCLLVVQDSLALGVHGDDDVVLLAAGLMTRRRLLEDHGHHRDILLHLSAVPGV